MVKRTEHPTARPMAMWVLPVPELPRGKGPKLENLETDFAGLVVKLAAVMDGSGIKPLRRPLIALSLAYGVGVEQRVQGVFDSSPDNLVKVRADLLFVDFERLLWYRILVGVFPRDRYLWLYHLKHNPCGGLLPIGGSNQCAKDIVRYRSQRTYMNMECLREQS